MEYLNHELCMGPLKKNLLTLFQNYSKPVYVYDRDLITLRYKEMSTALKNCRIYFAVKANPNVEVLKTLKSLGCGADVVSLGEIRRAMEAGFPAAEIVYSGVAKTHKDIREALCLGVYQINVESLQELERIAKVANDLKVKAPIALRLNPDIDIKTHPYIATGLKDNKFGIELSLIPQIKAILLQNPQVVLKGVSLHLGSMMMEFSGYADALKKLRDVYLDLRKDFASVQRFDFGGGLGVLYDRYDLAEEASLLNQYAQITLEILGGLGAELQSEPGRWLVAHAGALIGQVQYIKPTSAKTFVILDTGMNHLLRPALYGARHRIIPLQQRTGEMTVDVVGPICESADFLSKDCVMSPVQEGDLVAILDSGAYGFSMANNYNLQDMPEEIII